MSAPEVSEQAIQAAARVLRTHPFPDQRRDMPDSEWRAAGELRAMAIRKALKAAHEAGSR